MKQKVLVNDLRVGMYVCELDRPWSAVPFEPPFELQGFVVQTDDEIDKVRKHCAFVYVDVAEEALSPDPEPRDAVITVAQPGPAPSGRKARRGLRLFARADKGSTHYQSRSQPADGTPASAEGRQPRFSLVRELSYRGFREARKAAEAGEPGGGDTTTSLYQYVSDPKHGKTRTRQQDPARRSILTVYQNAGRADQKAQPAYADQCPVEEELAAAREIIVDTEKIYSQVLQDIQLGRNLNTDSVKRIVKGLVQSIVRNPDALNWLVRLKHTSDYAYSHAIAVCVMALTIGRYLGIAEDDLNSIGIGALLQDIGITRVPETILEKRGELNAGEREVVRQHVAATLEMLGDKAVFPIEVTDIIRSHHERYDGSGYPRGLSGDRITPFSTIAAMADTYEALISHRPYRPAKTTLEALTTMYELSDRWFPDAMVENLIQCVGVFPVGSFVMLNTGEIGVVISRNRFQQLKPRVMLVVDADGQLISPPESIDLAVQSVGNESGRWKITRVVDPKDHGLDPADFFAPEPRTGTEA